MLSSLSRTHLTQYSRLSYQDPFEEYQTRLAKKLAKRAEASTGAAIIASTDEKPSDDTTWFGLKVGTNATAFNGGGGGTSVGKYLVASAGDTASGTKRPLEAPVIKETPEDGKKKRKLGFGDFEGW
jgi:peptidyl-prolyl cis-trans isomerase-like protein 2